MVVVYRLRGVSSSSSSCAYSSFSSKSSSSFAESFCLPRRDGGGGGGAGVFLLVRRRDEERPRRDEVVGVSSDVLNERSMIKLFSVLLFALCTVFMYSKAIDSVECFCCRNELMFFLRHFK